MQIERLHVLLNTSIKSEEDKRNLNHLKEMKQHMAKEAESNKRTNAGESSEEDEDDDL